MSEGSDLTDCIRKKPLIAEATRFAHRRRARKRLTLAIVMSAIGALLVGGIAIYQDRLAPFRTTVITVNGEAISMRVFLRRTRMAGQDPTDMLATLTDETIVRKLAPAAPYNIRVTEADIDDFLRRLAARGRDLSDEDYRAWYRQQINESLMSASEFRDVIRARLLRAGLEEYLAARLPTVAEQVRLHVAPFDGLAAARTARARILAGESFEDVIADVSSEGSVRASGGDIGWQARSGLSPQIGRIAFDRLQVGEISEPYFVAADTFVLIKVSDRSAAREVDEVALRRMRDRVLDEWLAMERPNHRVEYYGLNGPYDSATDAWVRMQLSRLGN